MMRLIARVGTLLTLLLLLLPAGFAKSPAKSKSKRMHKKAGDTAASAPSDAKTNEGATPGATALATAAFPAQKTADNKKDNGGDYKPAPKFTPMLATTGTLGLFTEETADTLPKGGLNFSAYGNRFARMPGSVTVFQLGLDLSYGLTDWLSIHGAFNPYGHTHSGVPSELSLSNQYSNPIFFPLYQNTIFPTILPTPGTPGYVEDFPFAANNNGGVGEITVGVKVGLLSERRGDPFSLSIRNDLIIPTWGDLRRLRNDGTQSGQFNDMISMAISKQWGNSITATWDAGFRFTRDPRLDGNPVLQMADQFRTGAGLLVFPGRRFEPMSEYNALVFMGHQGFETPDTTFGARDPVDEVVGFRLYATKNIAFDIGYRYMLNLKGANPHDRHGFVVKIGTGFWPEKTPPENHPPTASCSADKSMVYLDSGDTVAVSAMASDPDNDPLTYTWSSSGGHVDGSGPQVRWLSSNTAVGSYTVTLHVDDGRGGAASCSAEIRVEPKPNHPPVIACAADRNPVFAGERVHITCKASDPDGDPLTYAWRANAGRITANGPEGDFDTTGLAPANYAITTRVEDGRGGAAEATTGVGVQALPPPPQASKMSECAFGKPLSTRIDNVCKRILDDVALRLQSEPRASAVIIGYSDPKERQPEKIAGDRATNTVKYLGEKGIDASRVSTRTGSGQPGADQQNRRIDVIWVPEGATY
jgi:outer membrane protein OmpA-like peptidoglycan-associated protein